MGTPHPFPEDLAVSFLEGLDEVLVIEELDPVIETELLKIAGKYHLPVNIKGKLTGDTRNAGENSTESVREDLGRFVPEFMAGNQAEGAAAEEMPQMCIRDRHTMHLLGQKCKIRVDIRSGRACPDYGKDPEQGIHQETDRDRDGEENRL